MRLPVEILNQIREGLETGYLKITGLGIFRVVERKARKGRNPKTGEELLIPAKKVIRFKASKNLLV